MFTFLCTVLLTHWVVVNDLVGAESGENVTCERPSRLSCEFLLDPLKTVIFDSRPEFGWECGSGATGYLQSGYQIIVRKGSTSQGSSSSKGDEQAAIWDTGRVDSDQSLAVEYAGPPLEQSKAYTWQVKVWNANGVPSHWSEAQSFRMARELSEVETSRYDVAEISQPAKTLQVIDKEEGYLADFGSAAFGYLKLRLPESQEEQLLEVHFGEKISGDRIDRKPGGSIRYYSVKVRVPPATTEVTVRPPRDRRNTTGQAIRLPKSIGVIAPFRYVEIQGLSSPIQLEDVTQVRIEYPFDNDAATFESSDSTLNAIWELSKYSIRATTFCGVYVDGDRERIPYEADAYINQLSHYGVDREYALARHSHEYLLTHPTWPTEWKQHSVLMGWADYWYTGDDESLARNYEILKSEKILTTAERSDGLVNTSTEGYRDIVDWPEAERDDFEMLPVNTVVNAFHYATLKRMADLSSEVGRNEDKKDFLDRAKLLKANFNRLLWNEDSQTYVDGEGSQHSSLHANLFPLAFGLVPKERLSAVVQFVKSRQMRCSVYAAQYLLEGLYQAEEDQYALELLTSRDKRSWFNMIRSGSTITLEAWDKDFKPNLDWNHAWGAAPANLISAYLVGVRPLQPGFKKIVVQPRPGELDSFTARVPSPRGAIQIRYERHTQSCQLEIEIPGNCTADIGIPVRGGNPPANVTWNGTEVPSHVVQNHAWIEDVPPGNHKLQASYSQQ